MARFWFRSIEMSTGGFGRHLPNGQSHLTSDRAARPGPPLWRTSYHRSAGATGRMREGPGRGRSNVGGAVWRRPAPVGRGRHRAAGVLAALGVEVIEAQAGGGYLVGDGTSPAAALVSGVAALIRSKFPKLTPAQVRD